MVEISLTLAAILTLILLNGVFAMSEIAVVSARQARLTRMAQRGDRGAGNALELSRSPGRFLSTIQVGITLVGVLSGAIGGASLAGRVEPGLTALGLQARYSQEVAVGLVVILITFATLILGELVPKRVALTDPERIASKVAEPMRWLARVASPVVRLLTVTTEAVLRLGGAARAGRPPVTEEEILVMIEEGIRAGEFAEEEQEIVERVFMTADRRVGSLVTPRPEIAWLDINSPVDELAEAIRATGHTRFPVCRGSLDEVLGVVQAKDLLAQCVSGQKIDLGAALTEVKFVPESMSVFDLLDVFREAGMQAALVMDEYGGLEGLVTTNDVLEALVGTMPAVGESAQIKAVGGQPHRWVLDGMVPNEELKELLGVEALPGERRGLYETLGGFVLTQLGRVPEPGDEFDWAGFSFEVQTMEGKRVKRVIVSRREKRG